MKFNLFILGTLFLFLIACDSDSSVKDQKDLLVGHWDLVEAQKNGKLAESLAGTYFEFTSDGKMSTNLPLKGGKDSTFDIKEGVIFQTIVNDLQVKYAIEELTETSLKLATKLRGYDFKFAMEKKEVDNKLSLLE